MYTCLGDSETGSHIDVVEEVRLEHRSHRVQKAVLSPPTIPYPTSGGGWVVGEASKEALTTPRGSLPPLTYQFNFLLHLQS